MKRKILSKDQYLNNAVEAIRTYIQKFCHMKPEDAREGKEAKWKLQEGSAIYWIELFYDNTDHMIFEVSSPILLLPEDNRKMFYKKLLELNASELTLSRFEIREDIVYLRHARYIEELDDIEITSAIHEVSKLADEWDNKLQDEFKCILYSEWDGEAA